MTIGIASDHGGFAMKERIRSWLAEWGESVEDFGCADEGSVDYPDYAERLCRAMGAGRPERGILVCGTGIGMSIAANKFPKIRATLVHDTLTARLSREHNDSNVLVLGGRVLGEETAREIVRTWLRTDFEAGRHTLRLDKIAAFEPES